MGRENTLTPFQRSQGDDIEERLRVLQDNLERCLKFITEVAHLDGHLLTDETLGAATTTEVNHKLGRLARGAIVIKQSAAGDVEIRAVSTVTVTVYAAGAMDVDLWVF